MRVHCRLPVADDGGKRRNADGPSVRSYATGHATRRWDVRKERPMTDRIDTEARLHTAMQTTLSETGRPLEDPAHPVDLEGLLYLPTKAVQDEKLRDAFRMFPADIAKQYAAEKVLDIVVHAGEGTIGMCAAAIETFLYNAKNIA
jgi:hypothetical protein